MKILRFCSCAEQDTPGPGWMESKSRGILDSGPDRRENASHPDSALDAAR